MINSLKGQLSVNYHYIKNLIGGTAYATWFDDGGPILFNNQNYFFEYNGAKCPIITVDFNSNKKGPNKLGYDIFSFYFLENGTILPLGATVDTGKIGNSAAQTSTYCSYSSNSELNGFGCA